MTSHRIDLRLTEDNLVGYCGVDSGTLMVVDPCYVNEGFDYDDMCNRLFDSESKEFTSTPQGFYSARRHGAPFAGGVVAGTHWGDGSYPVYWIDGLLIVDTLGMGNNARGEIRFTQEDYGDDDSIDETDWDAGDA